MEYKQHTYCVLRDDYVILITIYYTDEDGKEETKQFIESLIINKE